MLKLEQHAINLQEMVRHATDGIAREKAKVDGLLYSLLPKYVAVNCCLISSHVVSVVLFSANGDIIYTWSIRNGFCLFQFEMSLLRRLYPFKRLVFHTVNQLPNSAML